MDIDGSTAPSEARTILVCRSMYSAVMTPDHFLDPDAQNNGTTERQEIRIPSIPSILRKLKKY